MERSSTLREIFKFSIAHLYFFSSFAFHLGSVVTLSQALSRSGNLVSAGNGGWKPAFRGRGGTATVKNNKIRMKRISCSVPQTLLFREISLCSSSRKEIKKKEKNFIQRHKTILWIFWIFYFRRSIVTVDRERFSLSVSPLRRKRIFPRRRKSSVDGRK